MTLGKLFKKKESKGPRLEPHRDWLIILVLSGTALVLAVLYNIYVFREIVKGEFMLPSSEEVVVKTLDKEVLQKTYSVIETKKQKLEAILNGEVSAPNPSL